MLYSLWWTRRRQMVFQLTTPHNITARSSNGTIQPLVPYTSGTGGVLSQGYHADFRNLKNKFQETITGIKKIGKKSFRGLWGWQLRMRKKCTYIRERSSPLGPSNQLCPSIKFVAWTSLFLFTRHITCGFKCFLTSALNTFKVLHLHSPLG